MPKIKSVQLADSANNESSEKVSETETKKTIVNKCAVTKKAAIAQPRLYVNFKKKIESLGFEPKTMHPKIVSVRLSRKGVNSRFCFLVFKTEKSALSAMEALKGRGDCFVRLANTNPSPKIRVKGKKSKEKLRKLWA